MTARALFWWACVASGVCGFTIEISEAGIRREGVGIQDDRAISDIFILLSYLIKLFTAPKYMV
jgi:hypothetical protein